MSSPSGIGPTNISYENRCAPIVFPLTLKSPYPSTVFAAVHNQQPLLSILLKNLSLSFMLTLYASTPLLAR